MMKVVLIHGLARTYLSLNSLEWRLVQAGCATVQFGYAAFLESYAEIGQRLQIHLRRLSSQGPYSIVAHSLGGLLARSALERVNFPLPAKVVMLGTPNRPPRLAALAWQLAPFRWLTGQCGLNLASPQFFAQLPPLPSPYTIIAGTEGPRGFGSPFGWEVNDGIVALSETRLCDGDRPLEFPVNHAFMMNDRTVQETVIRALGLDGCPIN